jgi:hypothetical protein
MRGGRPRKQPHVGGLAVIGTQCAIFPQSLLGERRTILEPSRTVFCACGLPRGSYPSHTPSHTHPRPAPQLHLLHSVPSCLTRPSSALCSPQPGGSRTLPTATRLAALLPAPHATCLRLCRPHHLRCVTSPTRSPRNHHKLFHQPPMPCVCPHHRSAQHAACCSWAAACVCDILASPLCSLARGGCSVRIKRAAHCARHTNFFSLDASA